MINVPTYCIDSNVFISFIKGNADNDRTHESKRILRGMFAEITENKINVIFPTFERVEILACEFPNSEDIDLLNQLLLRKNIQEVAITKSITQKAAEIRNYYQKKHNEGDTSHHKISTPDAVVLATGIVYNCDRIITYDGFRDKTGKPSRRLLKLNNNVAGYAIEVTSPTTHQMGL